MVEITCNKGFRIKFVWVISYCAGLCFDMCVGNVCLFFFVCDTVSVCIQISCALNMPDITYSITHPCRVYICKLTNTVSDAVFGCAYLVSRT
jgi:hypothetical protein